MTRPRLTPDEGQEFNALIRRVRALEQQTKYFSDVDSFDVRAYGAVGDGVTDDWAAINRATLAAEAANGEVYFPHAVSAYMTSKSIRLRASIRGEGSHVVIRALPGLAGEDAKMIIDLTPDPYIEGLTLKDITLDADQIDDVQLVSTTDSRFGNAHVIYENITFQNTQPGVFAVGPAGSPGLGGAAPGMLVGANFISCRWHGCAQWVDFQINSDDAVMTDCRFHMNQGSRLPTEPPFRIYGAFDTRVVNPYFFLGECDFDIFGLKCVVNLETPYVTTFEGGLVEAFPDLPTDITHIIYQNSVECRFTWEGGIMGFREVDAPDMVAIMRTISASSPPIENRPRIRFSGIQQYDFPGYGAPDIPLIEHFQLTGAIDVVPFVLEFGGVDDWTEPLVFAPSSDTSEGKAVLLVGNHRGKVYSHWTDNNPYPKLRPSDADGRTGLLTFEQSVFLPPSQVDTAPPLTTTIELPSRGLYRLSLFADWLLDGENMAASEWSVVWSGTSTDSAFTQQIGTTMFTTASGYVITATSIDVSDPDTAGVLTITVDWSNGASTAHPLLNYCLRRMIGQGFNV